MNDITQKIVFVSAALAIAWLVHRFGMLIISRFVHRAVKTHNYSSKEAERKREDTINAILRGILGVFIWVIVLMTILAQLGVDIGPLIASAGVIGVAIGFGGQYLIRDVITGLFIIIENQYRVGDVVAINGVTGKIETITLRITKLRDLDGNVHYVPNGGIDVTTNMSQEFSGINLNIGVGYQTDLNQAKDIINRIGQAMANDPEWQDTIIEAPAFLRVDNLGDSAVELKLLGKVQPLQQWAAEGELRKRLKEAFDAEGIEIPYPHFVVQKN